MKLFRVFLPLSALIAPFLALAAESSSTPLPPPVRDFPIGRCVRVLGVTAPEDAKKIGFEYLELALQDLLPLSDAEFAAIVERLQANGLVAISGYGYLPADLKLVGPDVDAAKIDEHLRRGLDRARLLGLKMVVHGNLLNRGRSFPEGFPREAAWKQLVEFGRRASAAAQERGLTVLFEPMPPRSTNLVNNLTGALALVEAVDRPNFALLIDYGYTVETKEDLANVTRAARHIRQIEIQNPTGRVYPRRADEADYAAFFRALKAGGYRGGFSIHGAPKDVFVDAPIAITMLRTLAAQELAP